MNDKLYALTRPLLFALPPEEAHELTLKTLEGGFYPRDKIQPDPKLQVSIAGLMFPSRQGRR